MRYFLGLTALLALGAQVADAAPVITLDYNLTGAGFTQGPSPTFNSPAVSGSSYNGTTPTLTASASTAGNAILTQSPLGLGVRSGNGLNREVVIAGVGINAFRVDNVGIIGGQREFLNLTVSGIPKNDLANVRLTAVTFQGLLDLGLAPDVEVLLNNVSQGTFDYNGPLGGLVNLPDIALKNGDVLTFRPINAAQTNGFALAGVQLQAEVIPEPSSLLIFGGLLGAGALLRRRSSGRAAVAGA